MSDEAALPSISVVIVSHNREPLLRRSLESLGPGYELIVVDNGSTDGSAALETEFPHARFISLPKNFGLTKAMNLGLRSASGDYVLFLHDDTRLPGEAVIELAAVLESQPEVGAVAPLLVDGDGRPAPQVRELPSPADPDPSWKPLEDASTQDVPSVLGAAIMVRSFFLKAMRHIDEHYGNYGSAADLCAQVVRRAGKKIRIVASARAVHNASPAAAPTSADAADRAIGTAVFLGKYYGSVAGIKYRAVSTLRALLTFRLGMAKLLLSGRKVDGM